MKFKRCKKKYKDLLTFNWLVANFYILSDKNLFLWIVIKKVMQKASL